MRLAVLPPRRSGLPLRRHWPSAPPPDRRPSASWERAKRAEAGFRPHHRARGDPGRDHRPGDRRQQERHPSGSSPASRASASSARTSAPPISRSSRPRSRSGRMARRSRRRSSRPITGCRSPPAISTGSGARRRDPGERRHDLPVRHLRPRQAGGGRRQGPPRRPSAMPAVRPRSMQRRLESAWAVSSRSATARPSPSSRSRTCACPWRWPRAPNRSRSCRRRRSATPPMSSSSGRWRRSPRLSPMPP